MADGDEGGEAIDRGKKYIAVEKLRDLLAFGDERFDVFLDFTPLTAGSRAGRVASIM